jgi:hypothetical protein
MLLLRVVLIVIAIVVVAWLIGGVLRVRTSRKGRRR